MTIDANNANDAGTAEAVVAQCSSHCYQVIYADPPWNYPFGRNRPETHYKTMTVEEICDLDVCAADDAVLLIWATSTRLPLAFQVMEAWGFEYKTHAIWDKVKIGMGYWFRGQHELLLVGTRGKWPPPEPSQRIASVIREPRGRHSRKPDTIREWIELTWPKAKRIELFAREAWKGWDTFGNQVERTLFS